MREAVQFRRHALAGHDPIVVHLDGPASTRPRLVLRSRAVADAAASVSTPVSWSAWTTAGASVVDRQRGRLGISDLNIDPEQHQVSAAEPDISRCARSDAADARPTPTSRRACPNAGLSTGRCRAQSRRRRRPPRPGHARPVGCGAGAEPASTWIFHVIFRGRTIGAAHPPASAGRTPPRRYRGIRRSPASPPGGTRPPGPLKPQSRPVPLRRSSHRRAPEPAR